MEIIKAMNERGCLTGGRECRRMLDAGFIQVNNAVANRDTFLNSGDIVSLVTPLRNTILFTF